MGCRWRVVPLLRLACILLALGQVCSGPPEAPAGQKADAGIRWDPQYKSRHRNQMTRLARGETQPAIEYCEAHLEAFPGDLESHYVLAAAYARQGNLKRAMAHVEAGVAAGLPVERFLAGPRDLLGPLAGSDPFRAFARARASSLLHGPMVGAVTDSGARVWVRTAAEADVEVEVSKSPSGAADVVARVRGRTRADADFTAVLEVAGLEPDTAYACAVRVNGATSEAGRGGFRTFPKAGAKARFDVVFGGGAGYTPEHERMWTTIVGRRPLALLMLGDNVYIDTPEVPSTQRYCYYRRQSRPEWRRLVASTAVYAIYDDHDFFDNDCIPGPALDDPPYKRPVWRVFRENWVNPSYGSGEAQPGCWFAFSIGPVDFFMLDCRYYRTQDSRPPTMLGPVQKAWLKEALAASKGTFRVIASSVPWAEGAKPGSRDPWQGYLEERNELFAFLADRKIDGVILLSADRHRSDLWRIERPSGYPLYDFSSSRLTNIHKHGLMKGALLGFNEKCSFGLLSFDTTKADPEAVYTIVTIDGEAVHTFALKRSQLTGGG